MPTLKELGNVESLGFGFYIVRTQAGFKQALKQENYTSSVDNYPVVYPSLIAVKGLRISVLDLATLGEAMGRHMQVTRDEDEPIEASVYNHNVQVLQSREDRSVNFVQVNKGFESRYVRRTEDKILVYISSQTGCNQACRMCHLTQTKQTSMIHAKAEEMIDQARLVLDHYDLEVKAGRQLPAQTVHFNWMARGEPMLNPYLRREWEMIVTMLTMYANRVGIYDIEFKISTIMPKGMDTELFPMNVVLPDIYYSLYSTTNRFRKRWLPNAMEPSEAGLALRAYLKAGGRVILHWALIEDENDSVADAVAIGLWASLHGLSDCNFNLVRYNPYSALQGREPKQEVLDSYFETIKIYVKGEGSRIVPRVGTDIAASCGMFIDLRNQPKKKFGFFSETPPIVVQPFHRPHSR